MDNPTVGQLVYSSWGATMTIVDFYRIKKVSDSGKSVWIAPIKSVEVSGDGWTGRVKADVTDQGSDNPKDWIMCRKGKGGHFKVGYRAWLRDNSSNEPRYYNNLD